MSEGEIQWGEFPPTFECKSRESVVDSSLDWESFQISKKRLNVIKARGSTGNCVIVGMMQPILLRISEASKKNFNFLPLSRLLTFGLISSVRSPYSPSVPVFACSNCIIGSNSCLPQMPKVVHAVTVSVEEMSLC